MHNETFWLTKLEFLPNIPGVEYVFITGQWKNPEELPNKIKSQIPTTAFLCFDCSIDKKLLKSVFEKIEKTNDKNIAKFKNFSQFISETTGIFKIHTHPLNLN